MRICVFCGSSPGRGDRYTTAAAGLGRLLAGRGIDVVYGGATVGTMGVVADAALKAGGDVYGVIPQALVDREIAHTGLTELLVVRDMHERKATMAGMADGFIALPGGAGTLEELFEIWTWAQLGLHDKPLGLLDVDGFYEPLATMLDHMVEEGFLATTYREMVTRESDPVALLERLAAHQPPENKWATT
jgi:uncharacterized protein (TIGR00730 family)